MFMKNLWSNGGKYPKNNATKFQPNLAKTHYEKLIYPNYDQYKIHVCSMINVIKTYIWRLTCL